MFCGPVHFYNTLLFTRSSLLLIGVLTSECAKMADIWGEDDENDQQHEQDGDNEEEDLLDTGDTAVQQDDGALLMRFCPHDSSMLYPQVCVNAGLLRITR